MDKAGGSDRVNRGGGINEQKQWAEGVHKEEACRMKWFHTNEKRLEELVESSEDHGSALKTAEENVKQNVINSMQHQKRHVLTPTVIEEPPREKPLVLDIMKPVDAQTRRLLYTATQKDGRVNYLKARTHLYPEDRFYYPETSNFRYGWRMWDTFKNYKSSGLGAQQVIKTSFYRRRAGIQPDPDWYKQPSRISPTVCNCK